MEAAASVSCPWKWEYPSSLDMQLHKTSGQVYAFNCDETQTRPSVTSAFLSCLNIFFIRRKRLSL